METSQRQRGQPPQMYWKDPGIQTSLYTGWAAHSETHSACPRPNKAFGGGQHNGSFEGRMANTSAPNTSEEGDT